MLLAMIEAGRTVLLRRIGQSRGTVRESIPLVRWLLALWRTSLLWRRMALWQITSYRTAIDAELQLRRAITLLRVRYGRWHDDAPADLGWMVRTGVAVDEACKRIQALAGVEDAIKTFDGSRLGTVRPPPWAGEKRPVRRSPDPVSDRGGEELRRSATADVHGERFVEAMWLNRQHWIEVGRPISAETLRQRLHISADAFRELTRAMRAADRVVVIAASVPDGPFSRGDGSYRLNVHNAVRAAEAAAYRCGHDARVVAVVRSEYE